MVDPSYSGCCNVYSYYDYTYQRVACEAESYYDCGENFYYGYTGCDYASTCSEKCPSSVSDCESGGGGGDAGGGDSSLWYIYLIVTIVIILLVVFAVFAC